MQELAERHHAPHVVQVLRGLRQKQRSVVVSAGWRTRFVMSAQEVNAPTQRFSELSETPRGRGRRARDG